jgi:hypothetical protein
VADPTAQTKACSDAYYGPSNGRLSHEGFTNAMFDPPRLPPPPFWRTRYFAMTVLAKADRRWIDPLDVLHALLQPVRRDQQADGRIRYWAYIPPQNVYSGCDLAGR